jgi:hypothetical protein
LPLNITAFLSAPPGTARPAGLAEVSVDAFADRILNSGVAAFEIFSIYLGDRLGWYRSLAADGPATATELAN